MCMAYNKHGFCQNAFKLEVVAAKSADEGDGGENTAVAVEDGSVGGAGEMVGIVGGGVDDEGVDDDEVVDDDDNVFVKKKDLGVENKNVIIEKKGIVVVVEAGSNHMGGGGKTRKSDGTNVHVEDYAISCTDDDDIDATYKQTIDTAKDGLNNDSNDDFIDDLVAKNNDYNNNDKLSEVLVRKNQGVGERDEAPLKRFGRLPSSSRVIKEASLSEDADQLIAKYTNNRNFFNNINNNNKTLNSNKSKIEINTNDIEANKITTTTRASNASSQSHVTTTNSALSSKLDTLTRKFLSKPSPDGQPVVVGNDFASYQLIKVNKMNWREDEEGEWVDGDSVEGRSSLGGRRGGSVGGERGSVMSDYINGRPSSVSSSGRTSRGGQSTASVDSLRSLKKRHEKPLYKSIPAFHSNRSFVGFKDGKHGGGGEDEFHENDTNSKYSPITVNESITGTQSTIGSNDWSVRTITTNTPVSNLSFSESGSRCETPNSVSTYTSYERSTTHGDPTAVRPGKTEPGAGADIGNYYNYDNKQALERKLESVKEHSTYGNENSTMGNYGSISDKNKDVSYQNTYRVNDTSYEKNKDSYKKNSYNKEANDNNTYNKDNYNNTYNNNTTNKRSSNFSGHFYDSGYRSPTGYNTTFVTISNPTRNIPTTPTTKKSTMHITLNDSGSFDDVFSVSNSSIDTPTSVRSHISKSGNDQRTFKSYSINDLFTNSYKTNSSLNPNHYSTSHSNNTGSHPDSYNNKNTHNSTSNSNKKSFKSNIDVNKYSNKINNNSNKSNSNSSGNTDMRAVVSKSDSVCHSTLPSVRDLRKKFDDLASSNKVPKARLHYTQPTF